MTRKPTVFFQLALINLFAATLTFAIQPMISKIILPYFGGSSMVWNTALMFFQGALFLSYLYVHCLVKYAKQPKQLIIHFLLIVAALISLPVTIKLVPNLIETMPSLALIAMLTTAIGLPYFVICATSPLTQRWYANSQLPAKKSPYLLYAISNIGSLLALIIYPTIIEPSLTTDSQIFIWSIGFTALSLTLILFLYNILGKPFNTIQVSNTSPISNRQRLTWFIYAFVPSLYLMGTTLHISIDISATPFLWVIPLALYLLSFIVAFSRPKLALSPLIIEIQALVIIMLALYFFYNDMSFLLSLHLLGLLLTGLVCHGQLATKKPNADNLTEFYVWVALGGWFGGISSAIIAPQIFNSDHEYLIAILLACLVRPNKERHITLIDIAAPLILMAIVFFVSYFFNYLLGLHNYIIFGLLAVGLYSFRNQTVKFTVAVTLIMLWHTSSENEFVEFRTRTFFGIYDVNVNATDKIKYLTHGTTIHGAQAIEEKYQSIPLGYYNTEGPLGQVFDKNIDEERKVAVVGLGVGTIACYGNKQTAIKFYEIDSSMVELAKSHFTYINNCEQNLTIEVVDGRIGLAKEVNEHFDIIVIDAFSSDSIPIHLLSVEAISMYIAKLKADGVLLFHTSNRYINLAPVLARAASELKLSAFIQQYQPSLQAIDKGALQSDWVMFSKTNRDRQQAEFNLWKPMLPTNKTPLWTDQYSNLFDVVEWKKVF